MFLHKGMTMAQNGITVQVKLEFDELRGVLISYGVSECGYTPSQAVEHADNFIYSRLSHNKRGNV